MLWATIEKYPDERAISKSVSRGLTMLKEKIKSKGLVTQEATEADYKKIVDADWNRGIIWLRLDGVRCRIVQRKQAEDRFEINTEGFVQIKVVETLGVTVEALLGELND